MEEAKKETTTEEKDNKKSTGSRGKGRSTKKAIAKKVTAIQYAKMTPEVSGRLDMWLKKTYGKELRTVEDWKKEFTDEGLV